VVPLLDRSRLRSQRLCCARPSGFRFAEPLAPQAREFAGKNASLKDLTPGLVRVGGLLLWVTEAGADVVVDEAAGLKEGIADGAADELEAASL
jgi:hypothetical protein